jgi:F-type H+-transporting ATPase subunit gamma
LPSTRDLQRRIRSVKGTQQITKAMKMVAAAKLRRAQTAITEARPYADTLSRVLSSVAARTEYSHPLLEHRDGGRTWVVVISSDKGLCGSFNANLLRWFEKKLRAGDYPDVELLTIGRKASEFFASRRWNVVHEERDTMNKLGPEDGPRIGGMCTKAFVSGQVDEVFLVYNKFVNLIKQEVTLQRLLPIEPPEAEDVPEDGPSVDYLYEPDPAGLLETLLPSYVESSVQTALLDSAAAEQAARMTSMDAATKNAGEMIADLTLLFNRTRQAAITKELIEIVSGAQALEE